jgi:Protein of unknown function (DUF3108)
MKAVSGKLVQIRVSGDNRRMRLYRERPKPSRYWRLAPLACIVLAVGAPSFDFLKAPEVITAESGSTVATDSNGKPRWSAEWTMEPASANGRPAVRFTEKGRGRYTPYETTVNWTLESLWQADRNYRPLEFDKTFRNNDGTIIATEKKTFNLISGEVRFERNVDNKAQTKVLEVPSDTIAVEGIAAVLRAVPFDSGRPFRIHLLTNEPKLYDTTVEPRGRERVHTPAGDIECYKVQLVPHLGILNLVRPFLPKTYLWFSVAPPHFWVRYEGLEAGLGTPQITLELQTWSGSAQ